MNNKRVTIYDLAKAINLSPSYISKALNNHPSVGDKMKEKVRKSISSSTNQIQSQAHPAPAPNKDMTTMTLMM